MDLRSILVLSVLISTASAWPSGAPAQACRTRTPNHGVSAQNSTCPFNFVGLGWIPGQFTYSKLMQLFMKKSFITK